VRIYSFERKAHDNQTLRMIFFNTYTDKNGDIVVEVPHLSEASSEKKKWILDKKIHKNYLTVDPNTKQIIKYECECYDFMTTKGGLEPCKHLKESIALLSAYGIQISTTI